MAVSVKGALDHVIHVPSHYPSVSPSPQPSGGVGLLHGNLLSLLNGGRGGLGGHEHRRKPHPLGAFQKRPSLVSGIFLKCSALALNFPNSSL